MQKRNILERENLMKPITIAICDGNSRDAGVLEEYVRKLLPDAEITKLTKSHQLLNRMTENPNQFQLIFMEIEFEEEKWNMGCTGNTESQQKKLESYL